MRINSSANRAAFLALFFCCFYGTALCKEYRSLIGSAEDISPRLYGPVLNLEGGGFAADGAIQQMVDSVRGCTDCSTKLDVVFLNWTGDDKGPPEVSTNKLTYSGVDSIERILVVGSEPITPETAKAISDAEIVFFGGGRQCDFVTHFGGTSIEKAVRSVYKRGGGVGGTSAGQAIQGSIVFDACAGQKANGGLVTAESALADPYEDRVSFTYDFFDWKYMENTITDQHIVARKRLGRTLAFLARQIQDGKAKKAHAIAVDEATSVIVDKNGIATVFGKQLSITRPNGSKLVVYDGENAAYFITADHKPEVCAKGKRLTYSNFKIWKKRPGETFDLKDRPNTGYYLVSVKDGKLDRDPY